MRNRILNWSYIKSAPNIDIVNWIIGWLLIRYWVLNLVRIRLRVKKRLLVTRDVLLPLFLTIICTIRIIGIVLTVIVLIVRIVKMLLLLIIATAVKWILIRVIELIVIRDLLLSLWNYRLLNLRRLNIKLLHFSLESCNFIFCLRNTNINPNLCTKLLVFTIS